MDKENLPTKVGLTSLYDLVNIFFRLLPILFIGAVLISLFFRTPWVYEGMDKDLISPTNGGDSLQFQLKLADLSSGSHLLIGKTLKALENTYFELTIVYKPGDADSELVETYNNMKIIEARDLNGVRLARVGPNTDTLVLTIDSDDFQELIKQRPNMKNLYLVEQGTNLLSATAIPPPVPTFTSIPTTIAEVIFDLPVSDILKSDLNQFKVGDKIAIIISTQMLDPNGNTLERQSTAYEATLIGILDDGDKAIYGPPYTNVKNLRISISSGVKNQNIIAFANDLSGAVAIYLIRGK